MDKKIYNILYKTEEKYWWFAGQRLLLRQFLERYYDSRKGLKLLDIGCGTGLNLGVLAKFGIAYGMSPKALLDKLIQIGVKGDVTDTKTIVESRVNDRGRLVPVSLGLKKCEAFISGWHETFPQASQWLKRKEMEAKRCGIVRDWAGRLRRVHQAMSTSKAKWIAAEGARFAYNAPIQGGAGDVIKSAMPDAKALCDGYRAMGFFAEPLLQYYDALYFEIAEEILGDFAAQVKIIMESCVEFVIPITVEVEAGKTWGTMEKIKD